MNKEMYRDRRSSSRVSRTGSLSTPFAPRSMLAGRVATTPQVTGRHSPYFSLSDPHLRHYHQRRLETRGKRPSSAHNDTPRGRPQTRTTANESTYIVTVKTSAQPSAGTDARAYITLHGSGGRLGRKRLVRGGVVNDRGFHFAPGSLERFRVRGRGVDEVSHVTLEHDGLGAGQGWLVEHVTVKEEGGKGRKWECPCNQWLSLHRSDQQLSRVLKAHPVTKGVSSVTYNVDIATGDVRGAGTDANVFLTLIGSHSSTPKTQIMGCMFERGQVVSTSVCSPCHLGVLTHAVVEHDNTGFGPCWFLDELIVSQSSDPSTKTYFPCHQWLSRREGDGSTKRVLLPSSPSPPRPLGRKYLISTKTGTTRGAGTDANVFITLYGSQGCSGERRLDNDVNNFERGRKDTFQVQCIDLGQVEKIKIRHDNSGVGPGWFLEWVEVKMAEELWHFPCGAWLDAGEMDGCIDRELPVGKPKAEQIDRLDTQGYSYSIQVTTGSRPGAGTNANVYLILHGERDRGDSGRLWLEGGGRTLRLGQTDSFSVTSPTLVSPVEMVTVGHDNSGSCPGWFLDKVVVRCVTSGEQWEFLCHRWLCADEDDGRIERELHPTLTEGGRRGREEEKLKQWRVVVWTSDVRGAGTDANVTLQVHGRNCSSERLPIGDCPENFEQGEQDTFTLSLPDLGALTAITVSHDSTGPYPDWHLDKIEMSELFSGERYLFNCTRWLGRDGEAACVRLEGVQLSSGSTVHEAGSGKHSLVNGVTEEYDSDQFESSIEGEEELEGEKDEKKGLNELDSSIANEIHYVRQLDMEQMSSVDSSQMQSDHFSSSLPHPSTPSPLTSPAGQSSTLPHPHTNGTTTCSPSRLIAYEVRVSTADKKHAGTSNNLCLVLVGERGTSRQLTIKNPPKALLFQRGQTDTFQMGVRDVGTLKAIRVAHYGTDDHKWYLYQIVLTKLVDKTKFRFLCRSWVEVSTSPETLSYTEIPLSSK